jgi:hypothetical protein
MLICAEYDKSGYCIVHCKTDNTFYPVLPSTIPPNLLPTNLPPPQLSPLLPIPPAFSMMTIPSHSYYQPPNPAYLSPPLQTQIQKQDKTNILATTPKPIVSQTTVMFHFSIAYEYVMLNFS